jgi:hypothetical protein
MNEDMANTTHCVQPDSDPIETTFELNDTLFAKALVPPTEEVYLWLGVRLEFMKPACRSFC